MSEWFDSQKQSSSNFRKLLKERTEKSNPRRELNAEESKRLGKLEGIADKLRRGENVQNRQLQTWLRNEEYAQIEAEWQEQLELREELKDKPSDLKRYEEKLREATFNYNRAEGYSSKGRHSTAKKFYNKSERLCEDALEILQEILHYDSSLRIWNSFYLQRSMFSKIGPIKSESLSLPNSFKCPSSYKNSGKLSLLVST